MICFVLLDIARLYTERVSDVINVERAIMHVRRVDPFPLSKPRDFEKRESFGSMCESSRVQLHLQRHAISRSNSLSMRFPRLLESRIHFANRYSHRGIFAEK